MEERSAVAKHGISGQWIGTVACFESLNHLHGGANRVVQLD